MDVSIEQHDEEPGGLSRRQVLRGGVAAGATLLWVTPVISGIGLTSAHAAVASGGGSNPSTTPTTTATSTATSSVSPTSTSTGGTATSPAPSSTSPAPTTPAPNAVLGEQFTASPSPSPSPSPSVQGVSFTSAPTLPFTGAAVPVTGAITLGAGLVAVGATAVAASRHRSNHPVTVSGAAVNTTVADTTPEPPDAD